MKKSRYESLATRIADERDGEFIVNPPSPERKLLAAVLLRALADFEYAIKKGHLENLESTSQNAVEAQAGWLIEWFRSNDDQEGSFMWLCLHMFDDPEYAAAHIRKLLETRKIEEQRKKSETVILTLDDIIES